MRKRGFTLIELLVVIA
ncbi:MAG: hypothetical protein COS85_01730, partial [Armatimonadetes bacterium CG07_land_8_20_14_0_80_59_28]